MEYTRSFKAEVEIDTNKMTYSKSFDNAFDASLELVAMLTGEQRTSIFSNYCKFCGTTDTDCQCWNDE